MSANIPELERTYNCLNGFTLWLLILAGIIALLIGILSFLSSRKSAELILAKDHQFASQLKDKEIQIELIKKQAARDKQESDKKIATLNIQAEFLRNETEKAKQIIREQSERVTKVEEYQEQSALVKAINHYTSEDIPAATMKGHIHRVMGPYKMILPPADVGLSGTFFAGTYAMFIIEPQKGDCIVLAGTPLTMGNRITSTGDNAAMISLVCFTPNIWETLGINSIFIDGGS